jgi:hypothetical protein
MTWQEYQEAVAVLYEQMEGIGEIKRNVYLPDRITGQPRQIDVLLEITERGHSLSINIDAKFSATPLDVRDIEATKALSDATGINKTVIVTSNGFTKPAVSKADALNIDLTILEIDEALDLIVPDKWKMCPICYRDCIVLDQPEMIEFGDGTILWWLAGQCRECKCGLVHCQECGTKIYIEKNKSIICDCGYEWCNTDEGLSIILPKEVNL